MEVVVGVLFILIEFCSLNITFFLLWSVISIPLSHSPTHSRVSNINNTAPTWIYFQAFPTFQQTLPKYIIFLTLTRVQSTLEKLVAHSNGFGFALKKKAGPKRVWLNRFMSPQLKQYNQPTHSRSEARLRVSVFLLHRVGAHLQTSPVKHTHCLVCRFKFFPPFLIFFFSAFNLLNLNLLREQWSSEHVEEKGLPPPPNRSKNKVRNN